MSVCMCAANDVPPRAFDKKCTFNLNDRPRSRDLKPHHHRPTCQCKDTTDCQYNIRPNRQQDNAQSHILRANYSPACCHHGNRCLAAQVSLEHGMTRT
eukprot:scaffold56758_cov22-Prasinocladus_malaysianus.AAC.1